MEEDGHLQIGFYRSARAELLRYWIDYGFGDEYAAAVEMLNEHGRQIPEKLSRADAFVFDDPNQELFFKLRFSDAFMEEELFPWDDYDYDYYDDDYFPGHMEWEWEPEPVHDKFFIPANVKTHYALGCD